MRRLEADTVLFDLDGTLYRGRKAIPGASEAVSALRRAGFGICFLSNNSTHTPLELAGKLRAMGIAADPHEFVTPLTEAGAFLAEKYGFCRVFVLGVQTLKCAVAAAGHTVLEGRSERADAVLVGRDLSIAYENLEMAAAHVQRGAHLVAANTDRAHPGEDGYDVPESGAFLSAIRTVCPAAYLEIGKPSPYLFGRCGGRRRVMVGDNPETDILGGRRAGCLTVLIGTDTACGADAVISEIGELGEWLHCIG